MHVDKEVPLANDGDSSNDLPMTMCIPPSTQPPTLIERVHPPNPIAIGAIFATVIVPTGLISTLDMYCLMEAFPTARKTIHAHVVPYPSPIGCIPDLIHRKCLKSVQSIVRTFSTTCHDETMAVDAIWSLAYASIIDDLRHIVLSLPTHIQYDPCMAYACARLSDMDVAMSMEKRGRFTGLQPWDDTALRSVFQCHTVGKEVFQWLLEMLIPFNDRKHMYENRQRTMSDCLCACCAGGTAEQVEIARKNFGQFATIKQPFPKPKRQLNAKGINLLEWAIINNNKPVAIWLIKHGTMEQWWNSSGYNHTMVNAIQNDERLFCILFVQWLLNNPKMVFMDISNNLVPFIKRKPWSKNNKVLYARLELQGSNIVVDVRHQFASPPTSKALDGIRFSVTKSDAFGESIWKK
jgi:hypothetical protein